MQRKCESNMVLMILFLLLPSSLTEPLPLSACPNAYEFPCQRSFDSENRTICLKRIYHCDSVSDCPNGEDEEDCHDLYGALEKEQTELNQRLNISDRPRILPDEDLVDHDHNNCTVSHVVQGKCGCDLLNVHKVRCPGMRFKQIPSNMSTGIHVLNLDSNQIKYIDPEVMNAYWNLSTLSLKHNLIGFIGNQTFSGLLRLKRLYLIGNQVTRIESQAFYSLSDLKILELQQNLLTTLDASEHFGRLRSLKYLYLTDNRLKHVGNFLELPSLKWIDLGNNVVGDITNNFKNLKNLETLHLNRNRITKISPYAFSLNQQLVELDLSQNFLKSLDPATLHGLYSLRKLNMSYNLIEALPRTIFTHLIHLESLDLSGINIHNIHPDHFSNLLHLRHAYFWKFRYCTYVPHVRICRPESDGFSSLRHLLLYPILRTFIWIVAGITCFGNSVVIAWRSIAKKEHQTLSMLVKNLAFADLLMGLYLVIIGYYDFSFRDEYNNHALKWMNSWQCNLCGFLATFSSELSIFIVLLITIERYRSITMTCRFASLRYTSSLIAIIWVSAFLIASFPIIYWSHPDDPLYYSSNGMCFPLHVEDVYMSGWQFSAAIFLGINFPAVVLIIVFYARLFWIIKRDRELTRPALLGRVEHEDMILAFRIFFIVATDCLSWLPIVFLKLFAFLTISISPKVYAWVVVFILPINSALNPLIYTIAAPTDFRRRLNKYIRRLRKQVNSLFGFKSERFSRDHGSSSMSSHVTCSLDHTRTSNCSVMSAMSTNIPLKTRDLTTVAGSDPSENP